MKQEISPRDLTVLAIVGGILAVVLVMTIVAPPPRTVDLAMSTSSSEPSALASPNATPSDAESPTASADASASPDAATSGMVLYQDPEDGYELMLPSVWVSTAGGVSTRTVVEPSEFFPGVRRFGRVSLGLDGVGSYLDHPSLTVSVGTADGRVEACDWQSPVCHMVTVHSLSELADALDTAPSIDGWAGPVEVTEDMSLDGLPAQAKRPRGAGFCPGCGFHSYVYAIRNGHPIVLAFDRGATPGSDAWTRILETFHFTGDGGSWGSANEIPGEDEASANWRTVTVDAVGLRLDVPPTWLASSNDESTVASSNTEGFVAVRQYAPGELTACPTLGRCRVVEILGIESLVDAVADEFGRAVGLRKHDLRVDREPISMGTGEAIRITVAGIDPVFSGSERTYIVALRGETAIIIEWSGSLDPPSPLGRMLASLRFID